MFLTQLRQRNAREVLPYEGIFRAYHQLLHVAKDQSKIHREQEATRETTEALTQQLELLQIELAESRASCARLEEHVTAQSVQLRQAQEELTEFKTQARGQTQELVHGEETRAQMTHENQILSIELVKLRTQLAQAQLKSSSPVPPLTTDVRSVILVFLLFNNSDIQLFT